MQSSGKWSDGGLLGCVVDWLLQHRPPTRSGSDLMQELRAVLQAAPVLESCVDEAPWAHELQRAWTRLSLAKMAHTRLSCFRLDYDVLGLIAAHTVNFRPIMVVPRAAQLRSVCTNDSALIELNWFHSGCSDADVIALVDALSHAARERNPRLQRLWLHDNPRITDASAPGLLQVATAHWSSLELINLDATSMCVAKRAEIAAAVNTRSRALWNERIEQQRAQALRDEPARERRAQHLRKQESCRKRKKECFVGCSVAGAFLMLKVVWVIAGWIGDWF